MGAPKQRWTSEEEEALRAGVHKHGTGKWRTILSDPEFGSVLKSRSNVDLKDKWRNISAQHGSRRKAKLALNRTPSSGANQVADNTTALANGDNAQQHIDPTPPPPPVPFTGPFTSEDVIIFEAITNWKKPSGPNKKSIWRYIEDNFQMEPSKKLHVTSRLMHLSNVGALIKTKHRYRISPNFMAAAANLTSQRPEEDGVRDPTQSRVDGELIIGMTVQEAAVAAARAVAEADFAAAESEEATREADEAEALADAAVVFAQAMLETLNLYDA
ncbi:unnamed protein product [Thlaspi arvense]|uniref:MYB transcription factor n=1 Tax=Thlaspi arvense TaxID=13288 RepID=A0AAU9SGR2_THLAR|nr:unnamed protein product [Thlaspi arvense]